MHIFLNSLLPSTCKTFPHTIIFVTILHLKRFVLGEQSFAGLKYTAFFSAGLIHFFSPTRIQDILLRYTHDRPIRLPYLNTFLFLPNIALPSNKLEL